jgi:Xaa-Pro dipeptidase
MIPSQEIFHRIGKLQSAIKGEDLDGTFLLQNVDRFYFTGTIQSSILFVPPEGEPILLVLKGYGRAKNESPLREIIPLETRSRMASVLENCGVKGLRRVGLELDVLPASLYLWFQKVFPACRYTDLSERIKRIRMVKSPFEVERIGKAASILHKGLTEIQGILRPGMTELEIDGRLAWIARREGHMGVLRMRGWNQEMTYAHVLSGENGSVVSFLNSPHGGTGSTPAMAQGAGFRRVQRNEPIGIDYGVGIDGYLADQFRTFVIGRLPSDLERAHDCSREILLRVEQEARPGIRCSEIYRMAFDMASRAGLADHFMGHGEGQVKFVGHGFGLEIDEYPIFSPVSKDRLEEGMVFAVEPKFVFPGRGLVGIEDDYLVTPKGIERLTLSPQEVMKARETDASESAAENVDRIERQ